APCSPPPGMSSGSVPVTVEVSKLVPNSTYHYRVVASNANGSNFGRDETFTTPAVVPSIVEEAPALVGTREVLLTAAINPEHSETTYRFVYGPTSGYGFSVPAVNEQLGASFEDIEIAKSLTGL